MMKTGRTSYTTRLFFILCYRISGRLDDGSPTKDTSWGRLNANKSVFTVSSLSSKIVLMKFLLLSVTSKIQNKIPYTMSNESNSK